ncbi:unannotated protein [freshwater metagenome]|uniref:Unannotated protein n=1 Tax=freshwater metagenome TaxID=449393 RepID=A0A6J7JQ76_9ZZZZ
MHRNVGGSESCDRLEHRRVGQAAAHVIDDHSPRLYSGPSGGGPHGVDADDNSALEETFDHRHHTGEFLVRSNALCSGSGRLTADVDEIGSGLDHREAVRHCEVDIEPVTAVGKGIRCHVEYAHHEAALSRGQGVREANRVRR